MASSKRKTCPLLIVHAVFYKQHFYEQRHAETGKKSSKSYAAP